MRWRPTSSALRSNDGSREGSSGSGPGWSTVQRGAAVQGAALAVARSSALGGLQVTLDWPAGRRRPAVLQAEDTRADRSGPAACLEWQQACSTHDQRCWAHSRMDTTMLKWALIFAVISLLAGVLGFSGIAAGSAGIAKLLFVLFGVVCLVFVGLVLLGVGALKK